MSTTTVDVPGNLPLANAFNTPLLFASGSQVGIVLNGYVYACCLFES